MPIPQCKYAVLTQIAICRKIRVFCAIFWSKICVCAIFYAFSISASTSQNVNLAGDPKALFVLVGILVQVALSVCSASTLIRCTSAQSSPTDTMNSAMRCHMKCLPQCWHWNVRCKCIYTYIYVCVRKCIKEQCSAMHTSASLYQWVSELEADEGKQDTHPGLGTNVTIQHFQRESYDISANVFLFLIPLSQAGSPYIAVKAFSSSSKIKVYSSLFSCPAWKIGVCECQRVRHRSPNCSWT